MFTIESIFGISAVLDTILSILIVLLAFYQLFAYSHLIKSNCWQYCKHLVMAIGCLILSGGLYVSMPWVQDIINKVNWHYPLNFCTIVIVWILVGICIQVLWKMVCREYGSQIKHISPSDNDNVQMFEDWTREGHYHDPQNNDK